MLSSRHAIIRAVPALLVGLTIAAFAPHAYAQLPPPPGVAGAPGGPGGRGGNRPPLTPEQQKKRDEWKKWGETHKYVNALRMTLRHFERLDSDPKTALDKVQAKKTLAIIMANKSKPILTDDQSKKVNDQLMMVLKPNQLPSTSFGGGARPGGAGGPGGGMRGAGGPGGGGGMRGAGGPGGGGGGMRGGGGGGGMRGGGAGFTMPDPKEYNPLNPDTIPIPQMRERAKKGMDDLIKDLTARAK